MNVLSMTGFGRGESVSGKIKVTVEISTVNRKQFDCNIVLPRELAVLDAKVQACVRSQIVRGYVKGSIAITAADGAAPVDVRSLASQLSAIRSAAKELGLSDDLTASSLLQLPDAAKSSILPEDPMEVWPAIEAALNEALAKLVAMRRTEGENLEKDLRRRFEAIRKISLEIAELAPQVPKRYQELLRKRLADLLESNAPIEPEALAKEVALFADRCDVSEELTRLASHFEQAEKILTAGGACGRTLDFLCQEFFREINTTGSKANDAEIARRVIEFKTGLEAIREQVQNIE